MSRQQCLYIPKHEVDLKDKAVTLARIRDQSFSEFVWDLVRKEIDQNQDKIDEFEKLFGDGDEKTGISVPN